MIIRKIRVSFSGISAGTSRPCTGKRVAVTMVSKEGYSVTHTARRVGKSFVRKEVSPQKTINYRIYKIAEFLLLLDYNLPCSVQITIEFFYLEKSKKPINAYTYRRNHSAVCVCDVKRSKLRNGVSKSR